MNFLKATLLFLAVASLGTGSLWSETQEPVAASVVQSQEWTVHRGTHESEEFNGDVRYNAGSDSVRSDWALYDHQTKSWSLKGHVRVKRALTSGDSITAQGDEAFYDGISLEGRLVGKDGVSLSRQPALGGSPDQATAQKLNWQGQNEAMLTGSVHSFGPRLETWSDKAEYLVAAKETILSGGRPVARKLFGEWTGAVKADTIQAFNDPRRLVADGQVIGWIVLPQKSRPKPQAKKNK